MVDAQTTGSTSTVHEQQTVAIVPCTSQKTEVGGRARDVWHGPHFELILAHAEIFYDKVYIMSYKYGLIEPDFVIEPYDLDMRTAPTGEKLKWWWKMKQDIKALCETDPILIGLYTGDFERDRIIREFLRNGVEQIIVPFEGLGIGQRQAAVYDLEPPFDPAMARVGGYAIKLPDESQKTGPKYLPPPTKLTGDIEWE
jgi:hypothetical protein